MKSKKSRWVPVSLVLGVSLVVLLFSGCQKKFARPSAEITIAIMTTADLQSYITPYTVDRDGEALTVGGLERIASATKKVRGQVDGALLLSSGDDLIAPLFSLFHGEPEMRGMSLVGYDIVTPGNMSSTTELKFTKMRSISLNGADLKQTLEISASALRIEGDGCPDTYRSASGGFFQIGGLRITIDITKPPFCAVYSGRDVSKITNPGSRIVSAKVYQNGAWVPLDSSATYTVLVNGWTASGGDGHYIFLRDEISKENTTMFTTDILASYIQRHGTISPQVEERINFVAGKRIKEVSLPRAEVRSNLPTL